MPGGGGEERERERDDSGWWTLKATIGQVSPPAAEDNWPASTVRALASSRVYAASGNWTRFT
jgi:ABC-type molybdenum transport system ATPase subunit/photorepair protein PhrA